MAQDEEDELENRRVERIHRSDGVHPVSLTVDIGHSRLPRWDYYTLRHHCPQPGTPVCRGKVEMSALRRRTLFCQVKESPPEQSLPFPSSQYARVAPRGAHGLRKFGRMVDDFTGSRPTMARG